MRELAQDACVWIAASSLQATALLATAWLIERALVRHVWPQVLLTAWLVALARLIVPPTLASPWSVTSSLGAPALTLAENSVARTPTLVLALVWAAGTALCVLARIVRRMRIERQFARLDASDTRFEPWRKAVALAARSFALHRAPRFATLANLSQPAVIGLVRPTLLLPASWLARAPRPSDRHTLLHEVAHLKRGDLWLDEACEFVRTLFWFHPLVWLAVRRVRALTELACDASVARHLGSQARGYRATLVRAAREMLAQPAPIGSRAFLAHGSSLVLRIERLERAATRSLALVRGVSAAVAFALAACVLPMAPCAADLRARAHQVFAAERRGEPQSCFTLQAAAMVLRADSSPQPSDH